jgi:prepilin-type N-terminal cleavage/methylation domain-containing protein
MRNGGFTLAELMVVAALLSVVSLLVFMSVQSATQATEVAKAKADAQRGVREALNIISRELGLAAKVGDDSLIPVLDPVEIRENISSTIPVEVSFQVPIDGTGRGWSERILYQFVNEDLNGNALLDSGEDVAIVDGLLTRCIMRLQDRDGDGDTEDAGEQEMVARVNNLSAVSFALVGDTITVTATATEPLRMRRGAGDAPASVSSNVTTQIYLIN